MENILDRAIIFATEAHKGQFRKGTQIPYILHPMEAAAIVSTMTTDPEVIAGAVLHDVVEDTDTTIEDIQKIFGDRMAFLVCSETENKRENLSAQSTWKIYNIRSVYRDYNTIGDMLWQRFNQKDKNEHYWYYQGIADCLTELNMHQAYKEYCDLINKTFKNNLL